MHFYALLCTSLHSFALLYTPNWECILPMHSQLHSQNQFKKKIFSLFLVLGVHNFPHFYALPDFQNFFFGCFWYWECMILLIFMHSQIFKTFSISVFGSGSACFCIFLCTPRFPNFFYQYFWFWECIKLRKIMPKKPKKLIEKVPKIWECIKMTKIMHSQNQKN